MHSFHTLQTPRRDQRPFHLISTTSLSTTSSNVTPPPTVATQSHFNRLRSSSVSSLRFAQPSSAIHLHSKLAASKPTQVLTSLLLTSVPLFPSPTIYLSHFQPAANVYHSMLTMLAKHSLPQTLHNALLHIAVYPHKPIPTGLSPREVVSADFVRALSSNPPRIPVDLRNTLRSIYPQDKALHIALLASFGAYYSTVASLLGLHESASDAPSCNHENDILGITSDASELSASSSVNPPPSITSSARSIHAKISAAAKNGFLHRFTNPLRLKIARHSTHQYEKATFLASLPTTRRGQDDYVRAAMGFNPEYLTSLKNASHRASFLYIIDQLLLRDSKAGISTAVKNMCCYVLARSAENSVLTAHHAFLSHRFGATDHQLAACTDFSLLQTMHHLHTIHPIPAVPESISTFASSAEEKEKSKLISDRQMVKRRQRAARFRYSTLSDRKEKLDTDYLDDMDDTFDADDDSLEDAPPGLAGARNDDDLDESFINRYDPLLLLPEPEPFEDGMSLGGIAKSNSLDAHYDSDDSSIRDIFETVDVSGSDTVSINSDEPIIDIDDDPQVPELDGLNNMVSTIEDDDDDQQVFSDDDESIVQATVNYGIEPGFSIDDNNTDEDQVDMDLFTAKEVAFLLLAHQISQSWRRNSRLFGGRPSLRAAGALLSPQLVAVIHHLFDEEAIVEIVSIFGAFNFLQRWTMSYPYRPGALEAPVRRFLQIPFARDLGLVSVGERLNSKQSLGLRRDHRSLRIPKHAVVSPPVISEEIY